MPPFALFLLLLATFQPPARANACPEVLTSHMAPFSTRELPSTIDVLNSTVVLTARDQLCVGVMVAPDWALTASPCAKMSHVHVGVSSISRSNGAFVSDGRVVPIQLALNGPGIAAVKLAQKIDASLVRVNVNHDVPKQGSFARVIGLENGSFRQVDVPVAPQRKCEEWFPEFKSERELCARYEDARCAIREQFVGGPVLQFDEMGNVVLIGVVSEGDDGARAVRMARHAGWLREQQVRFVDSRSAYAVFAEGSVRRFVSGGVLAGGIVVGIIVLLLIVCVISRRKQQEKIAYNEDKGGEIVGVNSNKSIVSYDDFKSPRRALAV